MSETVQTEIDGVRFTDWYERAGISKSTAFGLLKVAGVEPEKRRVEGSRAPVSFLAGDGLRKMDAILAAHKNGKSVAELSTAIQQARQQYEPPLNDPIEEEAISNEDGDTLLKRMQAMQLAIATGFPLTTKELRWIVGVNPGAKEIKRGRIVMTKHARNSWTVQAQ